MPRTMKIRFTYLLPIIALFSCTTHHLTTAEKAYERMAYQKAASAYEKALRNTDDHAAALHAADSYQRLNQLEKAAFWYEKAHALTPLDGKWAMRHAQVLMGLGRSDKAIVHLESAQRSMPDDPFVKSLLQANKAKQDFYIDTTLYTVRLLDIPGISGAFGATLYGNGIAFAGEKQVPSAQANPWNGMSYLDLFSASRTPALTWNTAVPLPGVVNGRFHDGPAVFTSDGKTMYFTRSDYYKFRLNKDDGSVSHLKLFRAELGDDGTWGNIHQFVYNGEEFSTGHAALSSDGNTLYFVSDRPGGSGGTDLYFCERTDQGWGAPENLSMLNTAGNEMFPTINGDTLYFSSNGHPGLGGLDIFMTWKADGEWQTPMNMNYPLNTTHDDLGLVLEKDGRNGFLSSDRTGSDRIHSFTVHDPTLVLKGRCVDATSGDPIAGVEVKLIEQDSKKEKVQFTEDDGAFEFPLEKERYLVVIASKDELFTESIDLSTLGQRFSKTYDVVLEMDRMEIDKPIVINNIYYDYDKWDIRPDAALELQKLARLFKDNPDMHFELSSHTDSRASKMYNLVLSEARAKSAVDHLIRNGVDPQRVTARGYGETKLVNHCADGVECTEEQHQENRRTEFKVVRPEMARTR